MFHIFFLSLAAAWRRTQGETHCQHTCWTYQVGLDFQGCRSGTSVPFWPQDSRYVFPDPGSLTISESTTVLSFVNWFFCTYLLPEMILNYFQFMQYASTKKGTVRQQIYPPLLLLLLVPESAVRDPSRINIRIRDEHPGSAHWIGTGSGSVWIRLHLSYWITFVLFLINFY